MYVQATDNHYTYTIDNFLGAMQNVEFSNLEGNSFGLLMVACVGIY